MSFSADALDTLIEHDVFTAVVTQIVVGRRVDELRLDLELWRPWVREQPAQPDGRLHVRAMRPADWVWRHGPVGCFEITDEHPALIQFEADARLSYRGSASDPAALSDALVAEHRRVFGAYEPARSYLNAASFVIPWGTAAVGPVSLVGALAAVLERHGVEPLVSDVEPGPRLVGDPIPDPSNLVTLDLGDSFVVAERFELIGDLPPLPHEWDYLLRGP